MSDVLDQAEVDALLAAVESGSLGVASPEPAGGSSRSAGPSAQLEPVLYTYSANIEEQDVRNYDFKRPERVSKDQMRSLEALHETFARSMGASLSGFLRTIVECRVATIEQLTYSEFIHALPNPTCFNLLEAAPLEGQLCLELSPLIIYPIMDRLLGGSNAELYIPQRPLTAIELRLVRRITDRALACLTESWADVAQVNFTLEDTESNPQLVQIVAPNEVVVVIGFEIKMGARAGTMSLCIPFNVIEPVIGRLTAQNWFVYSRRTHREDQTKKIVGSLRHAKVELQCYLTETRITVSDLMHLRPGDIIQTEKLSGDELILRIEGKNKFAGRIGQYRGNRAFQITRNAESDERL
ncbi:MAG: Flagellar motor switch protein FliM [Phycisphaerae bacterium]|nr:Flagellar motor switch protein FliM [Phycisphaerae bacterium]